ncbi:MAG: hypothetical protein ACYDEJ_04800 [Desulfitobacteriaceae bacterium]
MLKKKFFAVLLCFTMLFSFTAPAFAATNIPDKQLSLDLETRTPIETMWVLHQH